MSYALIEVHGGPRTLISLTTQLGRENNWRRIIDTEELADYFTALRSLTPDTRVMIMEVFDCTDAALRYLCVNDIHAFLDASVLEVVDSALEAALGHMAEGTAEPNPTHAQADGRYQEAYWRLRGEAAQAPERNFGPPGVTTQETSPVVIRTAEQARQLFGAAPSNDAMRRIREALSTMVDAGIPPTRPADNLRGRPSLMAMLDEAEFSRPAVPLARVSIENEAMSAAISEIMGMPAVVVDSNRSEPGLPTPEATSGPFDARPTGREIRRVGFSTRILRPADRPVPEEPQSANAAERARLALLRPEVLSPTFPLSTLTYAESPRYAAPATPPRPEPPRPTATPIRRANRNMPEDPE